MLTGSDSAPAKANEAKQKNDIGSARDQVYLFASNAQTEAYETVYVKGKKTDNSGDDVTAGGASTEVSNYVKKLLKQEYPEDGTKKVGLATIVATDGGATITISTTDWKQEGTVSSTGGTLTWRTLSENIPVVQKAIGDTVNYSTTLNGVTLDDWKVFYVDGNYTYIIYNECLPYTALNSTIKTNYNLNLVNYTPISVYTQNNRVDFLNAMTEKSNWNELLTGTLNGNVIDYTLSGDTNIYAMGSPYLELWINSYNKTHSDQTLYIAKTASIMSDGLYGYYWGESEEPDDDYVELSTVGDLYSPYLGMDGEMYGYWLTSPSYKNTNNILFVNYYGETGSYNCTEDIGLGIRPIIKLPTSVVNQ